MEMIVLGNGTRDGDLVITRPGLPADYPVCTEIDMYKYRHDFEGVVVTACRLCGEIKRERQ